MRRRLRRENGPRARHDLEILIKAADDSLRTAALNRNYLLSHVNVAQRLTVHEMLDPRIPAAPAGHRDAAGKYAGRARGYRPITALAGERLRQRLKAERGLPGPYKGQVEQHVNPPG